MSNNKCDELLNSIESVASDIAKEISEKKELSMEETEKLISARLSQYAKAIESEFVALQQKNKAYNQYITDAEKKKERLLNENARLESAYNEAMSGYNEVTHAMIWKITVPIRKSIDLLKNILRKYKITRYPCKALKLLLTAGPKALISAIRNKKDNTIRVDYSYITPECRRREEAEAFPRNIKFSILVPLYNTPIKYLEEMIDSVRNQTYKNWELCLADGSDDKHQEVEERVREYIKSDSRIVYRRLEKNMGISENTNECIRMSTGDYIGLFDHDDVLHPSALYENMKAICEENADFLYTDEVTFEGDNIKKIITFHFKPDYAPDNLRSNNYICHFSVFSRELLNKSGMFSDEYNGSQDHDIILRLTENAKKIHHIRKLLYFWRSHPNSVAMNINSKTYAFEAGRRAVRDSIKRMGYSAVVESSKIFPTIYRQRYELKINPLVSIVIPNMNHKDDLETCIGSILLKTTYDNFEIVVIENNSTDREIFEYYDTIQKMENIRVVKYEGEFNYSKINNFGVKNTNGEYILFLNNDTKVISPRWIEELLMFGQREDVAAVGSKLLYADDTIQHAGVVLGLGESRTAGHSHYMAPPGNVGYMGKLCYAQNVSAVTAACMLVRKELFESVGGFDENLAVAFNDVDLCLKLREKDKLIVFNPYSKLYHFESKSRGYDNVEQSKRKRFEEESKLFRDKWASVLEKGDPYYNPNFSLDESYLVNHKEINKDKMQ